MASIVAGKPNAKVQTAIGLEKITKETRLQTIIFQVASTIFNAEKRPDWQGQKELFLAQLVRLASDFIQSDMLKIKHAEVEAILYNAKY